MSSNANVRIESTLNDVGLIKLMHRALGLSSINLDVASAYVRFNGLGLIEGLVKRASKVRLVANDITPKAYYYLVNRGNVEVRVNEMLHAKLYLIYSSGQYLAIVGSSNLTMRGLKTNIEVNVTLSGSVNDSYYSELSEIFRKIWDSSKPLNPNYLKQRYIIARMALKEYAGTLVKVINRELMMELGLGADKLGKCISNSINDRASCISGIYNRLRNVAKEARSKGMVEEEFLREHIMEGLSRINELGRLCGEAMDSTVIGTPCLMLYAAYELGKQGKSYGSGVEFYIDVLKRALELAEKNKNIDERTRRYINDELNMVENNKEYREQVVELKIGAVLLPLILALPKNCRVKGVVRGKVMLRRITCSS